MKFRNGRVKVPREVPARRDLQQKSRQLDGQVGSGQFTRQLVSQVGSKQETAQIQA